MQIARTNHLNALAARSLARVAVRSITVGNNTLAAKTAPVVNRIKFEKASFAPVGRRTLCTATATAEKEEEAPAKADSTVGGRFATTAEVVVSKIFPAGFGWQGMSVVADGMGYQATEVPFFLMTGLGDAAGVITGHTMYYAIKKASGVDSSIDMGVQFNTGLLLGTAAFHAGTAWQPIVNALHDGMGCSFNETVAGTMAGCGFMFYVGLCVGRTILGGMGLNGVAPITGATTVADAMLSVSIGGATACFVGTDVSFVANGVDQNWLRPVVGIEDGVSDLSGMVSAGTSTGLGFTAVQSIQNVLTPTNKCWTD